MRRPALALSVLGLVALAVPALATEEEPTPSLATGDETFWDGGFIEHGHVRSVDLCGIEAPCPVFPLTLTEPGARLRVAIDTPSREDTFTVQLLDPDGVVVASGANSNQFNEEVFVEQPQVGTWSVRVLPTDVDRAAFRMRAKLEATLPPRPVERVPLLPNVKTVPPYEFTFAAPANPLNGVYPPDTVNPPLDVAGYHPVSCTADEAAPIEVGGAAAVRCLRLTSGPINVGTGPFDLRFRLVDDTLAGTLDPVYLRGPVTQAVHFSDGSVELRPAGTYIFHTTHAHFHDENILTYELFRVTDDATGGLEPAGDGVKSGFCPADQLFGEWDRFVQQPSGTFGEGDSAAGGNCFSVNDGFIGLTAGWGDVYRWQRPGQYVEFAGNGDGVYVVRTTVDKEDHVLETDESDNAAYALIQVVGDTVEILERGQGSDPWDPRKVVFHGAGPASVTR